MDKFKKWLIPIAAVSMLLGVFIGSSYAPVSLGEIFDPSGNPFAHRFSDVLPGGVQGDVLYHDGTQWTRLSAGTSGEYLKTLGAGSNPAWDAVAGGGDAYITIAASDTPAKLKDRADYTCSGANDEATIEAQVAASTTIKLLVGTYEFDSTLDILVSDFVLEGSGPGTLIRGDVASDYIKVSDGATALSNVVISNLRIDGTSQTAGKGIYFQGSASHLITYGAVLSCQVENTLKEGVHFLYVDYGEIGNVKVDTRWKGVAFENCNYGKAYNNTCLNDLVYGLEVRSCSRMTISDNYAEGAQIGINLYATHESSITGNICKDNTQFGIHLSGGGNGYNTISNNVCYSNDWSGIHAGSEDPNTFVGNVLTSNGQYGLLADGADQLIVASNFVQGNQEDGIRVKDSDRAIIIGNEVRFNYKHGIYLCTATSCSVTGNSCYLNSQDTDNTYSNIALYDSDYCFVNSNTCRRGTGAKVPKYGIEVKTLCDNNIIRDNHLYESGKTANFSDSGTCTIVIGNYGTEITDTRNLVRVKNTSGGALAEGDVVILKSVAAGNEVTTTTTGGDDKVFGMAAEAINNNAYGMVLVEGKTVALKVDGTTDIAIGDFLCTFTMAGISQKAAAGDMAFAVALEAYATDDSNGVIDALLIKPRKL